MSSTPAVLRRLLETRPPEARPGERCEMCGEPIGEPHQHVAQVAARSLMCTCRGCWLLFTQDGAAQGRYLAVPEDCVRDPSFRLTPAQWGSLQIPVSMAFFFHNSLQGRVVTCYPSPGGATESELAPQAWEETLRAGSSLPELVPDVQAYLVRRAGEAFECYLVPIDLCYELVGLVRLHWKGFDGGEEAWAAIEGFFAEVAGRCRPPAPERP